MKKVGIMSMQRIYNYGSFLQAYGLKKMIESLGGKVTFIDYHPGKPIITSKEKKGFWRKISKVNETFKIKAPFKAKVGYIKYKKNYANNIFPLLGISSTYHYQTNDLDLLVIGSDEVFNCIQSNPKVGFAEDLFGKNSKAKRLISYAASFGNTTLEKLDKYKKRDQVKEMLNKFDALSVRDQNSMSILRSITQKRIELDLDPVLIYDFLKKENIPKINLKYKYLILYGYNGRFTKRECRLIKKFALKNNLKIICIGGIQHYCDYFINCKPFEVLAYFKNAEYIITDTFHGTIMSIINHKKFLTVVRNKGYGNSEKISDLLTQLELTSRKLKDISNLEEEISQSIDYKNTECILSKRRIEAKEYLKNEIEKLIN